MRWGPTCVGIVVASLVLAGCSSGAGAARSVEVADFCAAHAQGVPNIAAPGSMGFEEQVRAHMQFIEGIQTPDDELNRLLQRELLAAQAMLESGDVPSLNAWMTASTEVLRRCNGLLTGTAGQRP